jgi:D-glycero-D-manno-heptose 1,7-bisphosphate phosphatase
VREAIFLDRDGVINAMRYDPDNGLVDSPMRPEDFHLLPGVASAVRRINARGWLAIVVSNQPGVAKGKLSMERLVAITARMERELTAAGARLDGIYYCTHHPEAPDPALRVCDCRKPQAGLLWRAATDHGVDVQRSVMIGDGFTDVQAGRRAGCRTVWIGRRRCDVCRAMEAEGVQPDLEAADLEEAVRLVEAAHDAQA